MNMLVLTICLALSTAIPRILPAVFISRMHFSRGARKFLRLVPAGLGHGCPDFSRCHPVITQCDCLSDDDRTVGVLRTDELASNHRRACQCRGCLAASRADVTGCRNPSGSRDLYRNGRYTCGLLIQ